MSEKSSYAKLIHYPECWDTAAYPTLGDAIHEALAWSGCSECETAPKTLILTAELQTLRGRAKELGFVEKRENCAKCQCKALFDGG